MKLRYLYTTAILAAVLAPAAFAAPKAELWPIWERHEAKSTETIDHSLWQSFLDKYVSASSDGVHLVDYYGVELQDRASLRTYIRQLESTPISRFNRAEQLAYWVNFYNALTIQVILQHLPVDSIKDVDISPGFFSNGPWDAKLAKVEGHEISLNDIEHRILRPIWKDNRIHYAVNCASIGCPNLATTAFTGENAEALLEKSAIDFINHPRGARFEKGRLKVSSIFVWYKSDFGDSDDGIIEHLRRFARGELASQLANYDGGVSDDYNWDLNAVAR